MRGAVELDEPDAGRPQEWWQQHLAITGLPAVGADGRSVRSIVDGLPWEVPRARGRGQDAGGTAATARLAGHRVPRPARRVGRRGGDGGVVDRPQGLDLLRTVPRYADPSDLFVSFCPPEIRRGRARRRSRSAATPTTPYEAPSAGPPGGGRAAGRVGYVGFTASTVPTRATSSPGNAIVVVRRGLAVREGRPIIVDGRRVDPAAADEITVNERFAELAGVTIGDELDLDVLGRETSTAPCRRRAVQRTEGPGPRRRHRAQLPRPDRGRRVGRRRRSTSRGIRSGQGSLGEVESTAVRGRRRDRHGWRRRRRARRRRRGVRRPLLHRRRRCSIPTKPNRSPKRSATRPPAPCCSGRSRRWRRRPSPARPCPPEPAGVGRRRDAAGPRDVPAAGRWRRWPEAP